MILLYGRNGLIIFCILVLLFSFVLLSVSSLWTKPFERCIFGVLICLLLSLVLNYASDLSEQKEYFLSILFLLTCLGIILFYYNRIRDISLNEKKFSMGNLILAAISTILIMLPLRKSSVLLFSNTFINIVVYSITCFLFAFVEELTFRYLPMNQFISLKRFNEIISTKPNIRDILTIIFSSLLFSLIHFDINPSVFVGNFIFSVLISFVYLATKKLWVLVLIHGMFNILAM